MTTYLERQKSSTKSKLLSKTWLIEIWNRRTNLTLFLRPNKIESFNLQFLKKLWEISSTKPGIKDSRLIFRSLTLPKELKAKEKRWKSKTERKICQNRSGQIRNNYKAAKWAEEEEGCKLRFILKKSK